MPDPNQLMVFYEGPAASGPDLLTTVGGFALFFGVMWLLVLRPKQQEEQAQKQMQASLTRDDEVVLTGGIHGKIVEIQGELAVIEIAEKTRIRVDRQAITRKGGQPAAKT